MYTLNIEKNKEERVYTGVYILNVEEKYNNNKIEKLKN